MNVWDFACAVPRILRWIPGHRVRSYVYRAASLYSSIFKVGIYRSMQRYRGKWWCRGVVVKHADSQHRGRRFDSSMCHF